jgi:hypothetical protein
MRTIAPATIEAHAATTDKHDWLVGGLGAAAGLVAGTLVVRAHHNDALVESVRWTDYEVISDSRVRFEYDIGSYRSPSCWEPSASVEASSDDVLVVELRFRRIAQLCTMEGPLVPPEVRVDLGVSIDGRALRNPTG